MKRIILIISCIAPCLLESFYIKKHSAIPIRTNPLINVDDPIKIHQMIIEGTPINEPFYHIPPLLDALLHNKRDKALSLLQYGANPNCIKDTTTPLRWAIEHQDYDLIVALLKAQARLGKNDVQYAFKKGTKQIHTLLSYTLEYRAQGKNYVCKLDKHGFAPIHYAAIYNDQQKLDALMLIGASFNILSREKRTALHYLALGNNHTLINHVLANYNCNMHYKDYAGNSPKDLARDPYCKKLLT